MYTNFFMCENCVWNFRHHLLIENWVNLRKITKRNTYKPDRAGQPKLQLKPIGMNMEIVRDYLHIHYHVWKAVKEHSKQELPIDCVSLDTYNVLERDKFSHMYERTYTFLHRFRTTILYSFVILSSFVSLFGKMYTGNKNTHIHSAQIHNVYKALPMKPGHPLHLEYWVVLPRKIHKGRPKKSFL
jgi:hypothetical protein